MKFQRFSIAAIRLATSLVVGGVVGVVGVVGCSKDSAGGGSVSDFSKDLDLAASDGSSGLSLASSNTGKQQIVSLQEQNKQKAQTKAPSRRAPKPRYTPQATEQEYVEQKVVPEETADAEVVAEAPTVEAPAPAPVPTSRPQPVGTTRPGPGAGGRGNGGIGIGDIIGIAGVVIRGGVIDGDHCPPPGRRGGGRRPPIPINPLRNYGNKGV